MGGGNKGALVMGTTEDGLSPRGRGKRVDRLAARRATRSIPAWAGETADIRGAHFMQGVYPRVGGGNVDIRELAADDAGLSPRGRGKRVNPSGFTIACRSIPAWAGETICARRI